VAAEVADLSANGRRPAPLANARLSGMCCFRQMPHTASPQGIGTAEVGKKDSEKREWLALDGKAKSAILNEKNRPFFLKKHPKPGDPRRI